MAKTISSLNVILGAKTAKFSSGMRSAGVTVKSFSSTITAVSTGIQAANTVLIRMAQAFRAVVAPVKEAFLRLDEIGKVSRKLGLTAEALAGLQLAAEMTGVPMRQLNMGIQRMTRRMAEAAHDTGEAQAAIKELGLDAKKLIKLPLEEQLFFVADALNKVALQSERVRLGFKLFDSEGVALINTMKLGSKGLREMIDLTRRFGTGLSAVDIVGIERVNDSFRMLREQFRGMVNLVSLNLAPLLHELTNRIMVFGTIGTTAAMKVGDAFRSLAIGVAFVADFIQQISRRIEEMQLRVSMALESVIGWWEGLSKAQLDAVKVTTDSEIDALRRLETVGESIIAVFDRIRETWKRTNEEIAKDLLSTGALAFATAGADRAGARGRFGFKTEKELGFTPGLGGGFGGGAGTPEKQLSALQELKAIGQTILDFIRFNTKGDRFK